MIAAFVAVVLSMPLAVLHPAPSVAVVLAVAEAGGQDERHPPPRPGLDRGAMLAALLAGH